MNKTTVIYHSADFDGIFCREIARKFLPPDTEFIGWNFGDKPVKWPAEGTVYVMDLPADRPFGFSFVEGTPELGRAIDQGRLIWIDHHKSSIESHPPGIPGYRIDGVAACRLAWQWFRRTGSTNPLTPALSPDGGEGVLPSKQEFIERRVQEPLAVRLAGEYDIWDKRDPRADSLQFGLRARALSIHDWDCLLSGEPRIGDTLASLLNAGVIVEYYQKAVDAEVARTRMFDLWWAGCLWLAVNAVRCNSKTFQAAAGPHHDGLLGFFWNGKIWTVSLYHSPFRREVDLSIIAVKHGGGGHAGACGFQCHELPFELQSREWPEKQ